MRLVEEQQALEAVRQRRAQPGPPAQHLPGWQAVPQPVARQGAGFLLPAWQPAAAIDTRQQQQQQQPFGEGGQHAGPPSADDYADFLAVALQLLQDCGEQWLGGTGCRPELDLLAV